MRKKKPITRLNEAYIRSFFGELEQTECFKRLHCLIILLNIMDVIFIITSFYFCNSFILEALASLPGIGYSIYLHHNIIEAKREHQEHKRGFSISFIEFGFVWTILALIVQFYSSAINLSSYADILLLQADMILILTNMPVISGLLSKQCKRPS